MKTIGLIGGMSWESSVLYYQIINRKVQELLGGVHSCQCLLYSVDFAEIAHLQHAGDWQTMGRQLADIAKRLETAGAGLIVLCTNTMHKLADEIESHTNIPLVHIVDATAEAIQRDSLKKVGLLATRFSMEGPFLKDRYRQKYDIETIVPDQEDRDEVHRIIYEELVKGIIRPESKARFLEIIDRLRSEGAEGIIAGCTEIELLIRPTDLNMPFFETTRLHAEKAVALALG